MERRTALPRRWWLPPMVVLMAIALHVAIDVPRGPMQPRPAKKSKSKSKQKPQSTASLKTTPTIRSSPGSNRAGSKGSPSPGAMDATPSKTATGTKATTSKAVEGTPQHSN